MIEHKPWHRQPGESSKAFHAFMLYRDMLPKGRSLRKVGQELGKTPSYVKYLQKWSVLYGWVARAQAHDDHLAAIRAEAQEKAVKEMAERQAKEGMALQTTGIKRFVDDEGKLRPEVAKGMKDRDAIHAIDVGARIERTARGEPTEIMKQEHTIRRAEDLTDDELAEIIERERQLEEGEKP